MPNVNHSVGWLMGRMMNQFGKDIETRQLLDELIVGKLVSPSLRRSQWYRVQLRAWFSFSLDNEAHCVVSMP